MATNKKYKLTDGNMWATDGVYDFDQGKTQREVNGDLIGAITSEATTRANADTALESAIGIIIDGNKSSVGASVGQYIFLKNSTISGCADGSYYAKKAIPANTVIDSTYLTAFTTGAFNGVQGTKVGVASSSIGSGSYVATNKVGRLASARGSNIIPSQDISGNTIIFTGLDPALEASYFPMCCLEDGSTARCFMDGDGAIHVFYATLKSGKTYFFNATYLTKY